MREDIATQGNLPVIADDYLIQIADQAEKRIDAVIKIKQVSLRVTNSRDWTDQNGNPYLQVSGSEKIANLFNISWRIEPAIYDEEPDGHFTYSVKGIFSLGGRTIEVEGTRGSKDPFFNKYSKGETRTLLPPSAIDKGDVKKAALTNLFGNGITRMLGIRNLTWDDLQKYAGISQEMVKQKVSYNRREAGEGKPPIASPQAKQKQPKTNGLPVISEAQGKRFYAIAKGTGATDDAIHEWLFSICGWDSVKKITKEKYEEVCERVKIDLKAGREPGQEG